MIIHKYVRGVYSKHLYSEPYFNIYSIFYVTILVSKHIINNCIQHSEYTLKHQSTYFYMDIYLKGFTIVIIDK